SDERPVLDAVETFDGFDPEAALAIAAALERDAGHPLAAAFAHADTGLAVAGMRTVPGSGVEGRIEGRDWRLGQAAFAGGDADDGEIWLGDGRTAVARFRLRETLRP